MRPKEKTDAALCGFIDAVVEAWPDCGHHRVNRGNPEGPVTFGRWEEMRLLRMAFSVSRNEGVPAAISEALR